MEGTPVHLVLLVPSRSDSVPPSAVGRGVRVGRLQRVGRDGRPLRRLVPVQPPFHVGDGRVGARGQRVCDQREQLDLRNQRLSCAPDPAERAAHVQAVDVAAGGEGVDDCRAGDDDPDGKGRCEPPHFAKGAVVEVEYEADGDISWERGVVEDEYEVDGGTYMYDVHHVQYDDDERYVSYVARNDMRPSHA